MVNIGKGNLRKVKSNKAKKTFKIRILWRISMSIYIKRVTIHDLQGFLDIQYQELGAY